MRNLFYNLSRYAERANTQLSLSKIEEGLEKIWLSCQIFDDEHQNISTDIAIEMNDIEIKLLTCIEKIKKVRSMIK